jgi:hypothetical protein
MGVAGLGYYPDLIPKKKESYLPPPENGRVTVLASKPTRRCHYDVLLDGKIELTHEMNIKLLGDQ